MNSWTKNRVCANNAGFGMVGEMACLQQLGVVIGIGAAFGLTRLMKSLLFGVTA